MLRLHSELLEVRNALFCVFLRLPQSSLGLPLLFNELLFFVAQVVLNLVVVLFKKVELIAEFIQLSEMQHQIRRLSHHPAIVVWYDQRHNRSPRQNL